MDCGLRPPRHSIATSTSTSPNHPPDRNLNLGAVSPLSKVKATASQAHEDIGRAGNKKLKR